VALRVPRLMRVHSLVMIPLFSFAFGLAPASIEASQLSVLHPLGVALLMSVWEIFEAVGDRVT